MKNHSIEKIIVAVILFLLFAVHIIPSTHSINADAVVSIIRVKTLETDSILSKKELKTDITEGKGFFISSDGVILTNAHLVEDPNAYYYLVPPKGGKKALKMMAIDSEKDLAFLMGDKTDSFLMLKSLDPLKVGQIVQTYEGLKGEIIALNIEPNLIQTDLKLSPGDSGTPLLDKNRNVIDLNTAIDSEGNSFAIPMNEINEFLFSAQVIEE